MNQEEKKTSSLAADQQIKLLTIAVIVIQAIFVIVGFFIKPLYGLIMLLVATISYVIILRLKNKIFDRMNEYVQRLSIRVKRGEEESLIKMPVGIILYGEDNEIEWLNPYMMEQIGEKDVIGKDLSEEAPQLASELDKNTNKNKFHIHYNDKTFSVIREKENNILYLLDITQHYNIEQKYLNNRSVIGYLLMDNYDELTRSMDDREVLRFDTMMTTYLSNWFKQRNIFYKKIADDRYMLFTNRKELSKMEEDKFSIIDSIRERTSKRSAPLTISMGLAYDDDNNYQDMSEAAESNVDLALARGGDQAIVSKIGEEPQYYGGKSDPMIKRTRVRSRMVTQALEALIKQSESVFVMGHKHPDLDAIGSALGVRRIAEINHSEAYVVVDQNDLNSDVKYVIDEALENENLAPYIISPEEAIKAANENSLVVLVDHHQKGLSIEAELVDISNHLVIIDHHRRGNEFPDNPILVYVEPYASSASELVTEMFEYVTGDGPSITSLEATALLGGIVVDSNNFSLRTGSRTFNAASYLQSVGADNSKVNEMLAEDPELYIQRSHLVEKMEKVADGIYIAVADEDQIYNPVVSAQTADTMLSFTDVDASFVITKRTDGKIGISARSSGKINVQLIMEKMGGGGHLSNAATQLGTTSIAEAREALIKVIEEDIEK